MGKKCKKMQIEITRLNRIVVDLVLQQLQVILKSEVYLLVYWTAFRALRLLISNWSTIGKSAKDIRQKKF